MPGGVKNTGNELEDAGEAVLARAIANLDGVDAASMAGVLDTINDNNDLTALDGGGTDWASKSPIGRIVDIGANGTFGVEGSGYLLGIKITSSGGLPNHSLTIDGAQVLDNVTGPTGEGEWVGPWRFEEGFSLDPADADFGITATISYDLG